MDVFEDEFVEDEKSFLHGLFLDRFGEKIASKYEPYLDGLVKEGCVSEDALVGASSETLFRAGLPAALVGKLKKDFSGQGRIGKCTTSGWSIYKGGRLTKWRCLVSWFGYCRPSARLLEQC